MGDNQNHFAFSNFISNFLPKMLLILGGMALLIYTTLRAMKMSMTHDESGSFIIWADYPIFTCFFSPACWGTANLHWLYVVIMQPCLKLFGNSELAVRLPSLIAHAVYLWYSARLVRMWSPNAWIALSGFALLNSSPILLDFFSLARGYGLANTFILVSIYYLGTYCTSNKFSNFLKCIVAGFLAVLANFTSLVFFVCMTGLLVAIALVKARSVNKASSPIIASSAGILVLLAMLLYTPVITLMGHGEFEYGTSTYWETFSSLVKSSLYGVKYFNMYHVEILGGICVLFLATGLILALRSFIKEPIKGKNQFILAASLLPLLATLTMIAQHHLIGSQYLVNRTALLFLPLTAAAVFLLFAQWHELHQGLASLLLPSAITVFCFIHAARAYQIKYTSEWYYDFNTRAVMIYMDEIIPKGQQVKFGVHWIFHPSAQFYKKTLGLEFTDTLIYSKELRLDSFYDYYYVPNENLNSLPSEYVLEKMFAGTGFLMKKQGT